MTRERYESISLHDLREIAKSRGMRRISTLKKADLIDAMMEKDREEAAILQQEKRAAREAQKAQEALQEQQASEEEVKRGTEQGGNPEETGAGRQGETRSGAREGMQTREPREGRMSQEQQDQRTGGRAQQDQRSGRGQQGQQDLRQRQGTSGSAYTAGGGRMQRQQGRGRRDDRQERQSGQTGRAQRQPRQNTGQASGQNREMRRGQRNQTGAGYAGAPAESGSGTWAVNSAPGTPAAGAETAGAGTMPVGFPEVSGNAGAVLREPSAEYGRAQESSLDGNRGEEKNERAYTAPQIPQESGQETASAPGRLPRVYQPGRPDTPVLHKDELNTELDSGQLANGILEVMQDGFGFIRCANYMPGENDIYVAPSQIRRFGLKTGDIIVGNIRVRTQGEKFSALLYVKSVNGFSPEEANRRYNFEDMTPVFPDERIRLERAGGSVSMRIMDLMSPVGKGQRGMIVSPPKAGKTTLLKEVARSVKFNNPEIHLIVLLIDERPEEVTDIREAIEGPNAEVIYSTFDELPEHHKRVSEMAIERARRLVEHKKDVMILLDSITRLTRAYNITEPSSGRTLSGGLDPAALHMPKRFFGAARNMREGGSLTILATALIDTGSKMDDIVFEEFKGTGNMELVLDRRLSERRIFPAIDIVRSGTRRDDLLLTPDEQNAMSIIRRAFNGMSSEQAVTQALDLFARTRTNGEFVNMVRKIQWGMSQEHRT